VLDAVSWASWNKAIVLRKACGFYNPDKYQRFNAWLEPDWVLEQTLDRHRSELEAVEKEFEERLAKARKNEKKMREMENARARKRQVSDFMSMSTL
jgi:hypothetical protein